MGAKKKITGLGDVIATITTAIGIEPCEGCEKRKEKLNKLFPFGTKELTFEQKTYLQAFFSEEHTDLTKEQQKQISGIYFDVFQIQPFDPCTGCSGVWLSFISKLKTLDYGSSIDAEQ